MNIKADTPDKIDTTIKTLTSMMERHHKYTLKAYHYTKKALETERELTKFLRNEALGEP